MKRVAIGAVVTLVAVGGAIWLFGAGENAQAPATVNKKVESPEPKDVAKKKESVENADDMKDGEYKEFSMTSYYDEKGKWFSLKEIEVKKGDKVRIKVTNTKGMHDFVIDAYGIKKDTPLNQEVVIEFTADKAGEFEYYCSIPGHRAGGQFGTLRVTE